MTNWCCILSSKSFKTVSGNNENQLRKGQRKKESVFSEWTHAADGAKLWRKKNQDNVSIHQHLYRWTGQAKCPADSCWTGLVLVRLKALNKGSLCAFSLLPLGAEQQQRLREKGVEDETEHMQRGWGRAPVVHWPTGHPRVAVCMCKHV